MARSLFGSMLRDAFSWACMLAGVVQLATVVWKLEGACPPEIGLGFLLLALFLQAVNRSPWPPREAPSEPLLRTPSEADTQQLLQALDTFERLTLTLAYTDVSYKRWSVYDMQGPVERPLRIWGDGATPYEALYVAHTRLKLQKSI